jgi:hypothetical protein
LANALAISQQTEMIWRLTRRWIGIEVDLTSNSLNKQPIYASLGSWRAHGRKLDVRLGGRRLHGRRAQPQFSRSAVDLRRFVERANCR